MNDNNNQIVPDSKIREIFLRNGFTIKEGHDDLKPYVYAAARELIEETVKATRQLQREKHVPLKEQRNALNRNM